LLRVKGNVLQSARGAGATDVETCFTQSLELSRRQGARAFELRTATDLAALWAGQGRSADAQALLRPVFDHFAEGRDKADLKAAESLLASLA